ncbi:MAG: hypothetical protein J6L66_08075, partial [Anaerotignum sp.]|nr:hypothetical protein [Anaerotignum sp.]
PSNSHQGSYSLGTRFAETVVSAPQANKSFGKPFQRLAEREAAPHNKIDKSKGSLFEKFPFYS